MADSEEFRLKRLQHEQRLSRVFDEVMGLGDFADSSGGSATSSRSEGAEEARGDDTLGGPGEQQQPGGGDGGTGSKREDKTDEGTERDFPLPRISSPRSDPQPLFSLGAEEGGGGRGGGSGGAAFDDALDGLPSFGPEEEEEDWHFALPLGSMEEVNGAKVNPKRSPAAEGPKATPPREEEESRSTDTCHSSQDPNSRDDVLNQTDETEDSQQGERSEAAPMEDSNPPLIDIKDEPIDEGYDAALLPQSSIRQIKEELVNVEEELRISSVYSVGRGNAFAPPTIPAAAPAAAVPAPPPTTIFLQSRGGTVLHAMAQLPVRPPVPVALPSLAPTATRPPPPPSVRCSGCCKVLLKGQTAFQRKGSTQLFCSTVCLTGHLPPANKNRTCFQCHREIVQPRDMITIPANQSTFMHFCGQFCLSVFQNRKKQTVPDKVVDRAQQWKPEAPSEKPAEKVPETPCCTVCKDRSKQIEHEVTHQGQLYRLCSDYCFVTWRTNRQLAMNCCEGCGLYCNSSSDSCQTITVDKSQLNFCGPTCIGTYKQTCRKSTGCANCHKTSVVSSTIMELDLKGKVKLYCSSACVEKTRPAPHVLTGASFPCCQCKVLAVPQFHLAMVDGTIRNFCSYDCVSIYRKSDHTSQPDLTNGTSSLKEPPKPPAVTSSVPPVPQDYPSSVPYSGPHPGHTSVPPLPSPYPGLSSPSVPGQSAQPPKPAESPGEVSKLTCHQCSKHFSIKPQLFSHQGRISMFCSGPCCEQYKSRKNILVPCETCKQDKVIFDTINYNQQDYNFCSDNCSLLFKTGLTNSNKDLKCRPCTYCSGISKEMMYSHYGGRLELFCRPHCMSQYTVLYYGMARCDSCRQQGYMKEKLQCLGSVRHFCNLPCLLHYCHRHFERGPHTGINSTGTAPQTPHVLSQPHHSSKMNPVIADVVSLANGSATQPSVSADTALTGALPTSNVDRRNLDHASTQTDAMRLPVSRRRQMKNKSVLCRPFTVDKESMCQLLSPADQPADPAPASPSPAEEKVKVVMVPFPVPVFIPVPMNMYSQYTPVPMPMPLPVPVPMVIPARHQEMKDAAVQSEPFASEEEKAKDVLVSSADQSSVEAVRSELVTAVPRENQKTDKAVQADLPLPVSPGEAATEPTHPGPVAPAGENTESCPTPTPTPTSSTTEQQPASPPMDLETDFPSEVPEQKSSTPQRGVKRSREAYYGRKRGRRRTGSANRKVQVLVTTEAPKLNHLYGVKAWKSWVQRRSKGTGQSAPVAFKEDVLQCDSAELSLALSHFIREVRRPNGQTYSPDSIFYLCLGIQQYLFQMGRIENIFTDELYSRFAAEISGMLALWKPTLPPSGAVVSSRVMETYLWECKQLGAYSPIVLLNTLLFFGTKYFRFSTLAQHRSLSFTNFTARSKPSGGKAGTQVPCLRHLPRREETERLRRRATDEENELEMRENVLNPLQCPVRLYEFYLSRCPQSVKKRSDVFYLQPEKEVHTNSSLWYTCEPLEVTTLQSMLSRILAVSDVHQEAAPLLSSATDRDSLQ